jgi:hypothetical protein
MERMQRHSRKLAVWAIKACLGAERSRRLRQWPVCIYHRISFPLLYPAEFKLTKIQLDVLFFSDHQHRWQNIKLVVEELRHRRADLRLGLAFSDPREREEVTASFNLEGISTIAHITIGTLYLFDTRILYTSAIELPPSMVPPKARVVHTLISMLGLDISADFEFDADDYILCPGVHHVDSFRKLALRRPALLGKRLIPAGYPKLDLVLASCSSKRRPTDSLVRSTVVYAPTHEPPPHESALGHHGEAIINALIAEGHRVIFRPHPASFHDQDRPVIDRICQLHAGNPKFSLDASNDYTHSYSLADLMVTDWSGTGCTFSFSFGRPCIFFSPNTEAEHKLSLILFDAPHRIGALVRSIDEMIEKISELCNRDMTNEIERFRDETVFNVGKSAAYIVDCLEDILSGSERPEWVRL